MHVNASRVTPNEFVKIWQKSRSRKEVAVKLGMTTDAVLARAKRYHHAGVNLKKLDDWNPEPLEPNYQYDDLPISA